jgi:MFS superfamily sulfate permease-like transporter
MICRLHGLPYELKRPHKQKEIGHGCHKFEAESKGKKLPYFKLDRTIFYTEIAKLEREIREKISSKQSYKKTIADMFKDKDIEMDNVPSENFFCPP